MCAGRGPLKAEIDAVANMQDIGFQSQASLKKLIREAKFVVVPSVVYESFGLSAIESISEGTPVLASDIGGLREILSESRAGVMFKSGNKKDLKETVKSLWVDTKLLDDLRINSRRHHMMVVGAYSKILLRKCYANGVLEDEEESING